MTPRLLSVEELGVDIKGRRGDLHILDNVSLQLRPGEMHGLVGETGSGKSMTARAIVGLLPPGGRIVSGRILLGERDLVGLSEKEFRNIRGPRIGMIFQNPRTALHPLLSVDDADGQRPQGAPRPRARSSVRAASATICGWQGSTTRSGSRTRTRTSCREAWLSGSSSLPRSSASPRS